MPPTPAPPPPLANPSLPAGQPVSLYVGGLTADPPLPVATATSTYPGWLAPGTATGASYPTAFNVLPAPSSSVATSLAPGSSPPPTFCTR